MSVLIFDVECTDRENGEIIEAAWLRLGGSEHPDEIGRPIAVLDSFERRYQPSKPSTFGATAVHHLVPSDLEGCAPSSSFALPADTAYLIGHSIDFDAKAANAAPTIKRIDTCAMARALWPDADSHGQVALIYRLRGATPETREFVRGAHGAATDVQLNLWLLRRILEEKPEITTWSALHAFSEEARIPTVMFMGRNKGLPLAQLESGEIQWYLDRDFIDAYQRAGLERELARRGRDDFFNGFEDEDEGDEPEAAQEPSA